jgi:enamine deaminase RidA (YjgF/YER057c/UK114 family)
MTNNVTGAEARLASLGIQLPGPPAPFGAYVPAVQTGNLLFLSGMLATAGGAVTMKGMLGKELDVEAGKAAARTAALNALALIKKHAGSLDGVTRVVRLGIYMAATTDFTEHPQVANGASELFRDVFGQDKVSARLVIGVNSLPLGSPVELEVIVEVS